MNASIYTLDDAAARLNIGRNTLARRLREEARMLDRRNLPTAPFRGSQLMRVRITGFDHPVRGRCEYHRVLFTDAGLRHIAKALHLTTVALDDIKSENARD